MKPTRLHVALVALALIASAVPALAVADVRSAGSAAIVVQRGIDGVRLGMTREQVRARWGPADHIAVSYLGDSIKHVRMRWVARRLSAAFIDTTESEDPNVVEHGSSLLSVATRNRSHRTSSGAGPGSTENEVRGRVRDVACSTYRGDRSCAVGNPGGRQTSFAIRRGRVTEVSIADVF